MIFGQRIFIAFQLKNGSLTPERPSTLSFVRLVVFYALHCPQSCPRKKGLSAGTGKHCVFGRLELVFIWSCFVFCLFFFFVLFCFT